MVSHYGAFSLMLIILWFKAYYFLILIYFQFIIHANVYSFKFLFNYFLDKGIAQAFFYFY